MLDPESGGGSAGFGDSGLRDEGYDDPAESPGLSGSAEEGEDGSAVAVDAEAGEVYGDFTVAGTINNLFPAERPRLARGHFECYDAQLVAEQAGYVIASFEEVERCAAVLERHRLLFLTGEPESGKARLAFRVAAAVGERLPFSELLLCYHSLDRNVQVRLDDLCAPRYRERFLVFRDAIERKNLDLTRLVLDLDEARLALLKAKLAEHRVSLVFTADAGKLAGTESKLRGLGVLVDVEPLPEELLVLGLAQAARGLAALQGDPQLCAAVERLVERQGRQIVRKLRTMPRIARFVRETLVEVARESLDLEQALGRVDSLEAWLLRELPEDFEAWCYVLALTLCHAAPRPESFPWYQFDRLRQELRRYLERQLRSTRAERNPDALCQEASLCKTARAAIFQPGFPQPCSIRFLDAAYPAELWRILLGPGRGLLALLPPFLTVLARAPEPFLRNLAAQVAGRTGELDPYGIAFPLIEREEMPLGGLLQGILGSEDLRYRSRCMLSLRQLFSGTRPARARTAIGALIDVGQLDLDLALGELRTLCAERIAPAIDRERLNSRLASLEERAAKDPRAEQTLRKARNGDPKPLLAPILPPRGQELVEAVRHSLVGLCLIRNPIEVLAALASWKGPGRSEPDLGPLLALLFVREGGVFDVLERFTVPAREETGREQSPVLAWMSSPDDVDQVCRFLTEVYLDSARLPGALRQGLRRKWLELLKKWSFQVAGVPEGREMLVALLRALLASDNAEVGAEVLRLLRFDPEFLRSGSGLPELAVEIITGPRSA